MIHRKYIPIALQTLIKKIRVQRTYLSLKDDINPIGNIKNSHSGRVILLGSGSSINNVDLGLLHNENIIFMNNWHAHSEYHDLVKRNNRCYHIVAPVHGPSSRTYWEEWINRVLCNSNVQYILGINGYSDSLHKLHLNPNYNRYFYAPLLDRRIDTYSISENNYSLDNPIFGAGAVSVHALLLACFLGYDKIHLLGVDHSHILHLNSPNKGRFYDISGHTALEDEYQVEKLFSGQANTFMQYRKIKEHFCDREIINVADNESILDVFPRKSFSNVFS